jgi:glutathione S-transferase
MDLYFAPLACSMASRIAFYEAGAAPRFLEVDTRAKRLADGTDYLPINPLGQVPVLRTDDGMLLRENAVLLPYIAEQFPALRPADAAEALQIRQWLGFIGTELHKLSFTPLLDPASNDGARAYARAKAAQRLAYLDAHLEGRDFLIDRFTVADAYLVTVLNWSRAMAIDLTAWPAVKAYFGRIAARPAVSRAMAEEAALYHQLQARRQAA